MKIRKFIAKNEEKALSLNKEESAVIFLLSFILDKTMTELYSLIDEEIEDSDIKKFDDYFNRYLYENKPLQYLIGTCEFYGYVFKVNENVLIPRFETEELVENVLYRYDKYFNNKCRVVDIATGSGCIAITLAKEAPLMEVSASDISDLALDVARYNAHNLGADIIFKQGDMVEPFFGEKFDILVSNPPYIPETEEVMSLVKDNEPNIALFGGKDGLKFYDIILRDSRKILNAKAMIAFEHGYDKKIEIENLAHKYYPEAKVETVKDLEGKDRMTFIYIGF